MLPLPRPQTQEPILSGAVLTVFSPVFSPVFLLLGVMLEFTYAVLISKQTNSIGLPVANSEQA